MTILKIIEFPHPYLRKVAETVTTFDAKLKRLVDNMYETMYNAQGVGLAAPQVGLDLSIFIIDTTPFCDDENNLIPLKKEFINPEIIDYNGKDESFNEGCLSIPCILTMFLKLKTTRQNFIKFKKKCLKLG